MPPRTEMKFGDGGAVDVRAYGADPTGRTDSTVAIQAALDDAIGHGVGNNRGSPANLGVGKFLISDTLVIPRSSAQYGSVSLVGHTPWTTQLHYAGPADGRPAILADRQFMFHLGNFTLSRPPAGRGTSIGLLFNDSSGALGTQVISGFIYPMLVAGFNRGVVLGPDGGSTYKAAVSEFVFQKLLLRNCDIGMFLQDYNTLNIQVQFIDLTNNGVGLKTGVAGQVFVGSGAGSLNSVTDFWFGPSEARNEVRNYRTEDPRRLLVSDSGGAILDNCVVSKWVDGHDGIAIDADGDLMIRNSRLGAGKIGQSPSGNSGGVRLTLENTWVDGPSYLTSVAGMPPLYGAQVVAINSFLAGASTGPLAVYTYNPVAPRSLVERFRIDANGVVRFNGAAAPAQASVGAAADGTLADLTTKFNALQAAMKANGLVKT